jgi:hypothetical protein
MTAEPCSVVTAGTVYQITSAVRRLVDPVQAITVKDNGTTIASTLWAFNYLEGKVTFSGYTATGPVTVDAYYLPVASILEVKSFDIAVKPDLLDSTSFDSGGARAKKAGLMTCTGSFAFLSLATADLDTGTGGDQSLASFLSNGTPKLLEFKLGSSTSYFRAWVLISGVETKADVAGLVEGTANFELAPQRAGAAFALT